MNDPLDRLRPPPGLRMLITAGASGIGRCIAEGFTAAGAQVALRDIDSDALEAVRTTLPQAIVRLADVADEDAVAALAGSREAAVDVVLRTMLPYFGPRSSTLVGRRERADETLVERMNASRH